MRTKTLVPGLKNSELTILRNYRRNHLTEFPTLAIMLVW